MSAGGFGVDFSSDIESIETGIGVVCEKLLQYGVTSFCPTIVTSAKETYHQVCGECIHLSDINKKYCLYDYNLSTL